jgi:hypothetical protein
MKAEAARKADTSQRKRDELEAAKALVQDDTVQLEPSASAAAGAQAEQNAPGMCLSVACSSRSALRRVSSSRRMRSLRSR